MFLNLENRTGRLLKYATLAGTTAFLLVPEAPNSESSSNLCDKADLVLTGLGLSAPLVTHSVLKLLDSRRPLFEYSQEHKNLSTIITNLIAFGSFVGALHFYGHEDIEGFQRVAALGNVAVTGLHAQSLSWFEQLKPPYLRNLLRSRATSIRSCFATWRNDVAEVEKTARIFEEIHRDPSMVATTRSQVNTARGDYDLAFENFLQMLRMGSSDRNRSVINLAVDYAVTGFKSLFPGLSKGFRGPIIAVYHLSNGNIPGFISEFEQASADDLECRAMYVTSLEQLAGEINSLLGTTPRIHQRRLVNRFQTEFGSNEPVEVLMKKKREKEWNKFMDCVFARPDLVDHVESVDGHPVYVLNFHKHWRNIVVIKEGGKIELEDEASNLRSLDQKIKSVERKDFAVAQLVRIKDYNGEHYLIEKYASGERLIDRVERTGDLSGVRKSLEFLALIHSFLPVPEGDGIKLDTLLRRLLLSELSGELKADIALNMKVCIKHAGGFFVFDTDSKGDQYSITPEDVLTRYDLPSRGPVNAAFDVSKHVNWGRIYSNQEQKINDVLEFYLEPARRMGLTRIDNKRFLAQFLPSTPLRAISYTLYALERARDKISRAKDFLGNAILDLETVESSCSSQFTIDEVKDLIKLRNACQKLQSTIA